MRRKATTARSDTMVVGSMIGRGVVIVAVVVVAMEWIGLSLLM